jgi:hypothetical protein
MTSQRSFAIKTRILSAFVLFLAAVTALIAVAAPGRQGVPVQRSAKSSAAAPTQALPARNTVDSADRSAVSRLQTNQRHASFVALDNPLSFLPAVPYNPGGSGQAGDFRTVAVADVNGDGKPDMVVSNFWSSTVGVLLGNGDGTFQTAVTFTPGVQNSAIAIADVNGDGKPDLIVGIWSGGVGVLLGNGDGTFQPIVTYGSGGVQVSDVAVADLNRDGKLDLIVAN